MRIFVLAIVLTHMGGLADMVLADPCADLCRDDACATDCVPDVPCHCHCPSAMPAIATVQVVEKIRQPGLCEACTDEQQAHASPDPREIIHVPKHAV